jgi:hypothetical protein
MRAVAASLLRGARKEGGRKALPYKRGPFAALLGIVLSRESPNIPRFACIFLIVFGIIG